MFIAILFILAKTWKQPEYPWTEEWIKKIATVEWDIPLEHDSATKRKEIVSFALTQWI